MKINNSWQLISVRKVFTHICPLKVRFSMCSHLSFTKGINQVDSARNTQALAECCGEFQLTSFFQPGLAWQLVFLTRLFVHEKQIPRGSPDCRDPMQDACSLPPAHPPTNKT